MEVSSHSPPTVSIDGSFKHFMISWIRQTSASQFNLIKQVFSELSHEILPPLLCALWHSFLY